MALRGVQDMAEDVLIEPGVDQTTARKMIDDAIARWNKELNAGSGNGDLYKRWQHNQVSGNRFMKEPCWGDHRDQPEGEMLDKLKTIEFAPILDAAMRLTNTAKFVNEGVVNELTACDGVVGENWQDNNGQLARDKINALKTASAQYTDAANRFATNLAGFANESRKCIQRLVDFAGQESNKYFDYLGDDNHVDLHHFAEAIDEIDEAIRDGHDENEQPYNLEIARSNKPGLVIWEGFETWYSDVEKGRLDTFCENYTNAVGTFRRLIKECYDTIDRHLQTLLDSSSGLNFQPFAKLDELAKGGGEKPPEGKDQPPPKEGEEKPPGGGEKKPGSGGPGPGSGGPGPGSGGPGPGSGGAVEPPPAPPEPATDDPQKVDTGTDPSDAPGGTVDDGTGADGGAGKGETVTIEDGGKKISVTSPDSEGHVKVTVDDGTGEPKTYDMDFSQPGGTGGTPGAGTPGQAGPGQQEPVLGPDGQPVLGPDGEPVQTMPAPADGDPTAETLKPGPDGKIVLEDGNVTITAEHPPGQPDVVKLTVDDGTGEPTTYTLDYSDPTNPQVGQAEPAAAALDGQAVSEGRHAAQVQGFGGSLDSDFAGAGAESGGAVGGGAVGGGGVAGGTGEASFGGGSGSGEQPLQSVPGSDQAVQTTSTQAVAADFGGGAGGDAGFADSSWSTQGDLLSGGDDVNQVAPAAGEAGLAALPDDGAHHAQPNQAGGAAMGGMPMMGGMGGGAGGGDTERSSGQWSVTGDLFADEEENAPARIAGVLDEDVR